MLSENLTLPMLRSVKFTNKELTALTGFSNPSVWAKQPITEHHQVILWPVYADRLAVQSIGDAAVTEPQENQLKEEMPVADLTSQIEMLCNAGLHLVPIPPIDNKPTKAPVIKGWNMLRSATNQNGYSCIADDFTDCQGFNFGLYHAASNTLALDLDDMELAQQVFEDTTDFNLLGWLENDLRVEIKSPKANRGKLLFKVPVGFSASLRQLKKPKKDKPKEYDVVFELRAGNCQDVVYGQHPEGGHYQLIGNPAVIPEAPPVLLDMLLHWEAWKPCLDSALGIEQEPPKVATHKPQQGSNLKGYRDPIQEFNQAYSVEGVLLRNGYRQVSPDRFIRPNSSSKAPGIKILRNCKDGINRAFSFGGDDLNDGYGHSAWDTMRLLECGGQY